MTKTLAHCPGGTYICEPCDEREGGLADDFFYDDRDHVCDYH